MNETAKRMRIELRDAGLWIIGPDRSDEIDQIITRHLSELIDELGQELVEKYGELEFRYLDEWNLRIRAVTQKSAISDVTNAMRTIAGIEVEG